MASIRERARKDGTTTWAVLWRDADDGKQTSRTFEDQREARLLKDFLDANGNSFALAAKAAARMRSQAPTVATVRTHLRGPVRVQVCRRRDLALRVVGAHGHASCGSGVVVFARSAARRALSWSTKRYARRPSMSQWKG
ncbi:hypothetical protein ACH9DO_14920 [Kocuria sp. M1N1S27]|uniref:hypothetical protein n=1 Tax=Kocuria kalidii TaxID=3376283 RepID=UPI00378F0D69